MTVRSILMAILINKIADIGLMRIHTCSEKDVPGEDKCLGGYIRRYHYGPLFITENVNGEMYAEMSNTTMESLIV